MRFNSGFALDTSGADVVVLVGPNNAGKSRTLQEVMQWINLQPGQPTPLNAFFVTDAVTIDQKMSTEELLGWLEQNRHCWIDPNDVQRRFRTVGGGDLVEHQVTPLWTGAAAYQPRLGPLASHLIRGLWCGERLSYLASPQRTAFDAHPDHPVQVLVADRELTKKFSDAFHDAFGMNVVVDGWGPTYVLRLSPEHEQRDFSLSTADGLPTKELVERLSRLTLIETQSDGVRSFAGILLTLLAGQYPLVLLDEPEAFLHPPQARLLGRNLAELQREGQLFVATHSLDVLLGLIEARPDRVLIVRLTRAEGVTSADTLEPAKLEELWKDPLLRFSRVLDGLFHEGVIVCEGDTDTGFYSAVADTLAAPQSLSRSIMYAYAGNKRRIPLITKALRVLGVPVRVVADFDVLNDSGTLRAVVEGLGATYDDSIEKRRKIIDAHLRGSDAKATVGAVTESIAGVLGDDSAAEITTSMISAVRAALEPETGWRAAKRSGKASVPPGDATVAVESLLTDLEAIGLFIVPTGEVESFVRTVGGKGPRWLVEVITGGHLEHATEARTFVERVLSSFGSVEATERSKEPV